MPFTDDDSLYKAMQHDCSMGIQQISQDIVQLVKKNVQEVVYDPYTQMVRKYQRKGEQGGFIGSWTYSLVGGDPLFSKVFSDPELMVLDPPSHGFDPTREFNADKDIFLAWTQNSVDRTGIMDRAIAEGTDYDYSVPPENPNSYGVRDNWWQKPRDYFSPTIDEIENKNIIENTMKKIFGNNFRKI